MAAGLLAPTAAAAKGPGDDGPGDRRVVVMVLPDRTQPADLVAIDDAAIGLLSGGIGNVSASQAFLDIGQGARLNASLYGGFGPVFLVDAKGGIRPAQWQRALERVADAPTDLEPGLLASTLEAAGIPVRAAPGARTAAVIAANRKGEVDPGAGCDECPGLTVQRGRIADAAAIARELGDGDLFIAFEEPPAEDGHQLAIAIAGLGPGTLESSSTRLDGLVLSTDLAPTVLDWFGLEVPGEMSGRVIEVEPELDLGALEAFDDRLAAVSPRRSDAVGWTLVLWAGLTLAVGAAFRSRGLAVALPLLAISVFLLPVVLLATAALEPSATVEMLVAWLVTPVLAWAILACVGGWRALAVACALTVGAHAADVVAGSPLTSVSLLGPNPALGVRFYGIGNELEAILAALVLIGAGAALAGFRPSVSPRFGAWVFAGAAVAAVAAFAPGRFGADVGAAIGIPAGAAVAIGTLLGGGRKRTFLILAAPVLALAVIAAIDLVLGGDAHLSRSVLEAGGFDQVGQVAERRIRLCVASFERYAESPVLWATAAVIVAGIVRRREVAAWFEPVPAVRAAFAGAFAATVVGTLANDSGALLLMIGTALTSLVATYAWALRPERV